MAHPAAAPHRQRLRVFEQFHLATTKRATLLESRRRALAEPRLIRFTPGRRKFSLDRMPLRSAWPADFSNRSNRPAST